MSTNPAPDLISIFLLDDDENDLEFLLTTFKASTGFKSIDYRIDADGALEYLLSLDKLPDLIVTDLNMPKLTGFEFLKSVKSTPELTAIPVIVLSTSNSATDVLVAQKLGAVGFISKATSLDGFYATWDVVKTMFEGNATAFHYEM